MPPPPTLLRRYDALLDDGKRLLLRNPQAQAYEVREFSDGHIELSPRQNSTEISPEYISQRTLTVMDESMRNLAEGRHSEPIKTSDLLVLLDDDDRREIEEARKYPGDNK
ncbi:MAG: hypothetical protein MUF71_20855 [Candidatus Kapabacteria bacterium]|jgi:hypothetical protein|nr:hypothetical protein [Candidatus Kapabacteria bacterium]